jgi:hypothetical protein
MVIAAARAARAPVAEAWMFRWDAAMTLLIHNARLMKRSQPKRGSASGRERVPSERTVRMSDAHALSILAAGMKRKPE